MTPRYIRNFLVAAFSSATLLGSAGLFAQNQNAVARTTAVDTAENRKLNAKIVEKAYQDYISLIDSVSTVSSTRNDSLAEVFSKDLRAITGDSTKRIWITNVVEAEVGHALGMSTFEMVAHAMKRHNVPSSQKQFFQLLSLIASRYYTAYHDSIVIQHPYHITPDRSNGFASQNSTHIILPPTDASRTFDIEGLSRTTVTEFILRHEGWHALDAKTQLANDINSKTVFGTKITQPETYIENSEAQKSFALVFNREMFADIAACIDMIRHGRTGTEIIDIMIAERLKSPDDVLHMSVDGLKLLKEKIRVMTPAEIKALATTDILLLTEDIIENAGITPAAIAAFGRICIDSRESDIAVEEHLQKSSFDTNYARAYALYLQTAQRSEVFGFPLPNIDMEKETVSTALKSYQPLQAMIDGAFQSGDIVSPKTVIASYIKMLDTLTLQRDHATEATMDLTVAKIARLKSVFIYNLAKIDYVEENTRRGVPLEQIRMIAGENKAAAIALKP